MFYYLLVAVIFNFIKRFLFKINLVCAFAYASIIYDGQHAQQHCTFVMWFVCCATLCKHSKCIMFFALHQQSLCFDCVCITMLCKAAYAILVQKNRTSIKNLFDSSQSKPCKILHLLFDWKSAPAYAQPFLKLK